MTNPPTSTGVDWSNTTVEMAREIKDQGEKFMQAQLQVALASDQRSATMAGIFTAISTALIAGSIAYWDKTGSGAVLAGGLAGGLWMMGGVGLCLWAARPVDFYFPGNHPEQWYESRGTPLPDALGGEAENYQARIDLNAGRLGTMARMLKGGAWLVCTAPLVALLAFCIVTVTSSRAETHLASSVSAYSVPAKAPTPPQTSRPATISDYAAPAKQR